MIDMDDKEKGKTTSIVTLKVVQFNGFSKLSMMSNVTSQKDAMLVLEAIEQLKTQILSKNKRDADPQGKGQDLDLDGKVSRYTKELADLLKGKDEGES